jgi:anionic cell wall polymer biosynthesis LytR-Cps2A-Psr (LCP) family protein/TM2 domain-containing membrane protein YozV
MSSNPSPAVAALLSFIFPGAGQIYAGETRKGLIWAIPMVIFIVAVIWLVLGGMNAAFSLIQAQQRIALLVLNIAFFFYHVAAMVDAYDIAQRERSRGYGYRSGAPILLALLVSLAIILHGVPEALGVQLHNSLTSLAPSGGRPGAIPSFVAITPGPATSTPIATPSQPASTPTSAPGTPGTPPPSGSGGPPGTVAPRTPPPPANLADWPDWAKDDGRLNILVAGTDSRSDEGVDDDSLRTDTMLLLSIDIQAGKSAMFSFPRNLCTAADGSCGEGTRYPTWLQIPLTPGALTPAGQAKFPNGTYGGLGAGYDYLNSLWRYAAANPEMFPGSEGISGQDCQLQFGCERGWFALTGTIQQMTGQKIDGIVAVNLKGFVSLVDNLPPTCPPSDVRVTLPSNDAQCYGGVWLDVPEPLHDDLYHTSTQQPLVVDIQEGCQFFDSEMALAYSRARHESSDYDRARRQQYVLQQVRKQLDPLALLPHIPALLGVAEANLFMTFGDADIQFLAQAASRIDADRIYQVDYAPGHVNQLGSMAGMRDEVSNIFNQPEPQPSTKPNQSPCPPR